MIRWILLWTTCGRVAAPAAVDGHVEKAGEGLWQLVAVGRVNDEVAPGHGNALEAVGRRERISRMRSTLNRLVAPAVVACGWSSNLGLVFLSKISASAMELGLAFHSKIFPFSASSMEEEGLGRDTVRSDLQMERGNHGSAGEKLTRWWWWSCGESERYLGLANDSDACRR